MTYKALKNCKFDRKYSVGELIDGSVIDPQCLPRAVKFGSIECVAPIDVEKTLEAPVSDSVKEGDEESKQRAKGRKRANKGA